MSPTGSPPARLWPACGLAALLLISPAGAAAAKPAEEVPSQAAAGLPRVLEPEPQYVAADGDQSSPATASGGGVDLTVWEDSRPPGTEPDRLYAARVGAEGLLDPAGIALPEGGSAPNVAYNGSVFLVVYRQSRDGSTQLRGLRITPQGRVLDPDGFLIRNATAAGRGLAEPAISSDGAAFLVAWQEPESSVTSYTVAARVSGDGTVPDPAPIQVGSGDRSDRVATDVAFDGTHYLVVWDEGNHFASETDIYGARVSPAGAVRDPGGFVVNGGPGNQSEPTVGFNGTVHLVAWADGRTGRFSQDLWGARVSPDGSVLDPEGTSLIAADSRQRGPDLATIGGDFLMVWHDDRFNDATSAARISGGGTVLDPGGFPLDDGSLDDPVVSVSGGKYLVTWVGPTAGVLDIRFSSVTVDAKVQPFGGKLLSRQATEQFVPDVAFDGEQHLAVFMDRRRPNDHGVNTDGVYATLVGADGTPVDQHAFPIADASGKQEAAPRVASNGKLFLVVWAEEIDDEIRAARVTRDGRVLDPGGFVIATGEPRQSMPDVVGLGNAFLVVWVQDEAPTCTGCNNVLGTRVTGNGTVQDPGGFVIGDDINATGFPAAAGNGDNAMVVWESDDGVVGSRVDTNGEVLDPAPIGILAAREPPAVAAKDGRYLVAAHDRERDAVVAARVAGTGRVLDSDPLVLGSAPQFVRIRAGATGTGFLVGWSPITGRGPSEVIAARVSPTGAVLAPATIATSPYAISLGGIATTDGGQTLVGYRTFVADSRYGAPRALGVLAG